MMAGYRGSTPITPRMVLTLVHRYGMSALRPPRALSFDCRGIVFLETKVEAAAMEEDLIYDVGLHNGDDTAYYLSKGYRVVAIEADPALAALAHERFENDIERGRLTLLNVAIGPKEGVARFWICDEWSEWNSFDRAVASRQGKKHHAIDVRCREFRNVLREYGVPYYLKVDIENSDHCCIDGLDHKEPPRYVSLEFGRLDDLVALHRLGYNAFKVIHQEASFGHAQFHARRVGPLESLGRKLRRRRTHQETLREAASSGSLAGQRWHQAASGIRSIPGAFRPVRRRNTRSLG